MNSGSMDFIYMKYAHKKKLFDKSVELMSKFDAVYKNLTKEEKMSLNEYKLDSRNINMFLYSANPTVKIGLFYVAAKSLDSIDGTTIILQKIRDHIASTYANTILTINAIDRVFSKTVTTDNITKVYKGMTGDRSIKIKRMHEGDEFVMDSYTSTSFAPEVSMSFADNMGCFMVISVPKNIPYIYLPFNTENLDQNIFTGDEFEILLPRGATLRLIKKEIKDLDNTLLFKSCDKTYKTMSKDDSQVMFCWFDLVKIEPLIIGDIMTIAKKVQTIDIRGLP